MCLAKSAFCSADPSAKTKLLQKLTASINVPQNEVKACLSLGELGKIMNLSTVPNIIN